MNPIDPALDFSTVIASTVHDMKNSLAMLMQAHSQWLARLPKELRDGSEQGVIDFEFAHLNGMLVQLLGLYKLGVNQLPLQPAYHELDDFIEAQLAAHQEVFASRGIIATYEVDPLSPLGFFDRELIASVLGNCINNARRNQFRPLHRHTRYDAAGRPSRQNSWTAWHDAEPEGRHCDHRYRRRGEGLQGRRRRVPR